MIRTRTKIEAVLAVAFLLAISISSVFAVTRTISDTSDTVYTQIICGNGNTYEATYANLVTALALGGEVYLPEGTITLTNTITIPNTGWLHGRGEKSILYLGNAVNKTMVVMNNNTRISDLKLDGNNLNQDAYAGTTRSSLHPLIYLGSDAKNIRIDSCSLSNAIKVGIYGGNIYGKIVRNITVDKVKAYNSGAHAKAHGLLDYFACGMWFENATNIQVSNCYTYNCYSCGYIFEAGVAQPEKIWTNNFTVSNCIAEKSCFGLYLECAKNGAVTNFLARDCNDVTIYGVASGFKLAANSKNIMISNSRSQNGGTADGDFAIGGSNNSVIGCESINSLGIGFKVGSYINVIGCRTVNSIDDGIYAYGEDITILNCEILNPGDYGIYTSSDTAANQKATRIEGNHISDATDYAIYTHTTNAIISGNVIENCDTYGMYLHTTGFSRLIITNNIIFNVATYGIYEYAGGISNSTISNNIIYNAGVGIQLRSGCSNITLIGNRIYGCTSGIVEASGAKYNIIVANNCLGCTTPIDKDHAQTVCEHNLGTVS